MQKEKQKTIKNTENVTSVQAVKVQPARTATRSASFLKFFKLLTICVYTSHINAETYILYLMTKLWSKLMMHRNMWQRSFTVHFHHVASTRASVQKAQRKMGPVFPIRRPIFELFLSPRWHQKPPARSVALRTRKSYSDNKFFTQNCTYLLLEKGEICGISIN